MKDQEVPAVSCPGAGPISGWAVRTGGVAHRKELPVAIRRAISTVLARRLSSIDVNSMIYRYFRVRQGRQGKLRVPPLGDGETLRNEQPRPGHPGEVIMNIINALNARLVPGFGCFLGQEMCQGTCSEDVFAGMERLQPSARILQLSYEGSDLGTCNAVSHCLLLSYFPSPSILFIPVVKRRWVLRRELFRRLGTILGFFATGMNRMDGIGMRRIKAGLGLARFIHQTAAPVGECWFESSQPCLSSG
jgi:hypothetical protein